MYPVLKESVRDMSWVFHIVCGHITFDVAAIHEIAPEEFIEMINRIATKRAFIFENSILGYPALKNVLRNRLTTAN